jgi:hypothetical protein
VKVKLKQLKGECLIWDGTNQEQIRELVGDRFLGVQYDKALVRAPNGVVVHMYQGMHVIRWDSGNVSIHANGAFETVVDVCG